MRFWKWKVLPRNWRKVRKAQSSLPDENSFHPPDEELEQRARQFAERAAQLLEELTPHSAATHGDIQSLQYFLQSENCYAELRRRQDIRRADRETKEALERNERDRTREIRHFWIELIVIGLLIVGEICLSLYFGLRGLREGRQQAEILKQMNKNTEDTAVQIQRAANAMTATLQVLQADRADRLAQLAKKPRLALYVGSSPIDKTTLQLASHTAAAQDSASLDLSVKNVGDAPVSTFRLHALTPEGVFINIELLFPPVPEFGPPERPNTQRLTIHLPPLPAGEAVRIRGTIYAPKGHSDFKIPFTADAFELQAVAPLGSLTVLSPKP